MLNAEDATDSMNPVEMNKVKIKKEKITPPSTPKNPSADDFDITNDFLDNILGERKPDVEPIKSSNEILADLFKVFNAAPPTLDNDDNSNDSKTKKKHKKEKKSKKQKKRKVSDESTDSINDDKPKAKKLKKEKKEKSKEHKKSKNKDKDKNKDEINGKKEKSDKRNENSVKVKKEPTDDSKSSKESNPSTKLTDKKTALGITVSLTKDNDGTTSKRQIVIKSLVNSTVYQDTLKEVEAQQKEKERKKEKEKEKERHKDKRKRLKHRSKSNDRHHRKDSRKSRSSSLSLSDEETYLREREHFYPKDRSRERDRSRAKVDDFYGDYRRTSRERDRDHESRGYRSRNNPFRRRSRSSSRHRHENSEDRIDKKRLLEIARKNAITMLKNGTLPGTQNLAPEDKEKALVKMRYGGKTVDELTEFCKKLSKGEANGYLSSVSGDSDIDADLEKPFHHPFVIKDRGPIVMNIKNATPIPPKSAEQTKAILMQFPVSSGQHHRANESEWVPVVPTKPKKDKEIQEQQPAITIISTVPVNNDNQTKKTEPTVLPTTDYGYNPALVDFQAPEPVPMPVLVPAPAPRPVPQPISQPVSQPISQPAENTLVQPPKQPLLAIEPAPVPAPQQEQSNDNIFADTSCGKGLDVTAIITTRLNAMRKLQDNPLDTEALKLMYNTQKDMTAWASSKFVPGQFTGSTGANILTSKELSSGFQAWAKRDQLLSTQPMSGGMGMHLLQKMGWKPGEGLGKEKNGSLQPLLLEVKLDKKGLVADEETPQGQRQQRKKLRATTIQMAKQNFESKHPVSLLGELSAKRKFGAPLYELVMQEGPSHQRQFLFRVSINGQIYQPNTTSLNKKEAKAAAAKFALQQMGYVSDMPTEPILASVPQPIQQPNFI